MEFFNNFCKIVLIVEYTGGRYSGFQWQTGLPTVQAELELAIQKATGENRRIMAASRTDAGVHAKGQVVSFRTQSVLSPSTFVRALNYYLPRDIAVRVAGRVDANFNVRRDAVSREYNYRILNSSIRSPLAQDFAYRVANKLDVEIMNKACRSLEGEHDFASFTSSLGEVKSTVRNVYKASVTRENDIVNFYMIASSFLPHQVRNTVGLLIRVGLGKVGLEGFNWIAEARTLGLAGPTAPAYGLCLTKVNYPSDLEIKYENLFD